MSSNYYVIKRNGNKVGVQFDKITSRIEYLTNGLDTNYVDPSLVAKKVIQGIYAGVTTVELDNLAADVAASLTTTHPDYAILAARIAISNLHKETNDKFSEVINSLHEFYDSNGRKRKMISDFHHGVVMANADRLNMAIVNERDYNYNFFGFKTLEKNYLMKINDKIVERPQYMLMRVAVGIHGEDIDAAIETYNLLSEKYFTHATPTLFHAATPRPSLSSCFLLNIIDDSIEGIFQTMTRCAYISKSAGGIGLSVSNVRAAGSKVGVNCKSKGLIPMLTVVNETALYVDQGGNKRPGAFAMYLEPWHADIFAYLDLRKNHGDEDIRARHLFYALWIPDLFMKRVEEKATWSLMCPHECPGLDDVWGDEFEKLYMKYENEGRFHEQIPAEKLWRAIIDAQIETGTPYMLYKDQCNKKSNQQNLGTIKCSNLCTEIVEYTSKDEVAVCNLASVAVNMFVDKKNRTYDFKKLKEIVKIVTRNLNKVIDINYYPVPEAEYSNKRHRPIGIGIQGLADAFILMRYAYDSPEATLLNQQIFETLYYGALEASCEIAEKLGPYDTYEGSPVSKGILQYEMWNKTPTDLWDWSVLKNKIAKHGIRNSLLLAPMPTASTAQILGNNESFEAYTSNVYTRRTISGDFQMVNQHLLKDLIDLDLWNEDVKSLIIANNGSIQQISSIPDDIKELYKTVWEISNKVAINMAADRGAFIDQSHSLNLFIEKPNYASLTSMHFYAWKLGLKTGMYYLRTKPAANAIQFTLDKQRVKQLVSQQQNDKLKNDVNHITNGFSKVKV